MGLGNHCYIFDLTKILVFPPELKQVLQDREIIKVFHDFCEDTSALVRQYGVHCDGVFDTQIAHRLLKQGSPAFESRDQNISLNAFLAEHLGSYFENDQKDLIVGQMKTNPDLWYQVGFLLNNEQDLLT